MYFPAPDAKKKAAAPATTFSGKKKKQQLQAKRQRKREAEERQNEAARIEESIREALVDAHPGEEVTLEAVEAAKAAYYQSHGGGGRGARGPHGRKEHRRARRGSNTGPQEADKDSSPARQARRPVGAGEVGEEEEYMYDAHGHGVRSAFKESAAELAVRRRMNFLPLADRQFMDGKVGIPFGRWFVMPRQVGDGASEQAAAKDSGDGAAPRPVVSADGIGSSLCFPFSVDIPSRGWVPPPPSSSRAADAAVEAAVTSLPNETVVGMNAEVQPTAAVKEDGSHRRAAAEGESSSSSGGSAEESDESGHDDEDDSSAPSIESEGEKHKPLAGSRGAVTAAVDAIEEARFRSYLKLVEAYPLPEHLAGLVASSCERNLEVWRQLWRTIEASDVSVVVADARYPVVHTHLGLLSYLTRKECKPCVLVLNKSDLVPQSVTACWQSFIPSYLASLGFTVMALEDAAAFMRANSPASLKAERKAAPIVLRTFTADPSKDTAVSADADATTSRRRRAKQRRAKMYEQLRAGHLDVSKDLPHSDDEMLSEDETAYDASANFKGKEKAERNLNAERCEFNELKIVSHMITDLLATCRALAPAGKGVPKANATQGGEGKDAKEAGRGLPTPPMRRAHAGKKKRSNRSGTRQGEQDAERRAGEREDEGNVDDDSSATDAHDVVDTREEDDEAFIHIGFIGYPNVGKSSLLNCIRGTKVVSVSPTPGHTKHLQTIPIPAEGVTLVDSPGLVAPCYGLPRPLEAVLGTHQIAQTRDPQSGIAFLASHLPLEKIYGLRRPEDADEAEEWSAFELCEAYAKKRGYFVKHGKGALDVHRAAIAILQEAYQGRLTLYFAPPELNYLQSKHYNEKVKPHLLLRVFKHN